MYKGLDNLGPWKSMGTSKGIDLYCATVSGSKYDAFKGVTKLRTDLRPMVAMFQDTSNMPNWMYSTKSIEVLDQISEVESIRYLINEIPYPLMQDRDVVVHTKLTQNDDRSIEIRMTKKAGIKPDSAGKVRIPRLDTQVNFIPAEDGEVIIEYLGHIEPGGVILSKVYNLMLKDTPLETMKEFRQQLKKYQTKNYDHLNYIQPVEAFV